MAWRKAPVLMIAYRLHFEAVNVHALRRVRAWKIAEAKFFTSRRSCHSSRKQ